MISRRSFFSRRNVLAGAGAVALAPVLPAIAQAAPVQAAPLPPPAFDASGLLIDKLRFPWHSLRMGMSPAAPSLAPVGGATGPLQAVAYPRLQVSIMKIYEDAVEEFPSLRALLFDTFPVEEIKVENVGPDDTLRGIDILLLRQTNLIAARTRRGAGNLVLVSPDTRFRHPMPDYDGVKIVEMEPGVLQPNEAVVLYRGSNIDTPVLAERTPTGYRAIRVKRDPRFLGDASDYGAIMRLI